MTAEIVSEIVMPTEASDGDQDLLIGVHDLLAETWK